MIAGQWYNRERGSSSVFKSQILCGLLVKFLIVCDGVFEYVLVSILYEEGKLVDKIQLHCIKIEKITRFVDFFPKNFPYFSRVPFLLC